MEHTTIDDFCGSKFWDWNSSWYTENPRFTECFEKTVLIWIPCAFLWAFSILEIGYLRYSKHRDIPWNILNLTKMLLTSVLVALSIADLAIAVLLFSSDNYTFYYVDLYTPVIKASTFSLIAVFVLLNRKCGIRTSFVQFIFWLLCLVCGISQLRTEIVRYKNEDATAEPHPNGTGIPATTQNNTAVDENKKKLDYFYVSYLIYYPCVVLMFLLSCLADARPKLSHFPKSLKPCPEESSGSLSRLWFFWIDPLIYKGYRKPLEMKDLWNMQPDDTAKEIIPRFERLWKPTKNKYKRTTNHADMNNKPKYANIHFTNGTSEKKEEFANVRITNAPNEKKEESVLPALMKTFWKSLMLDSFLNFLTDVLVFANPQLLKLLILFVEQDDYLWKGYLYAFVMFGAGLLDTLICAQFHKRLFTFGMRVKTLITSMVYRKALRMSNSSKKQSTVGEIVNLMAVDSDRVVDFMYQVHMLWSVPMQIVLALYFLYDLLGVSVFVGFSVMVMLIPVNGVIANRTEVLQMKQMKMKDERIKLMNEILNGVKVLKLYAWEPSFSEQVLRIRDRELEVMRKSIYLNAGTSFIWFCAPFMVSIVTFATYVLIDENNVLDASKAFVSISLFNILQDPLTTLPGLITSFIQAMVSVKRLNKFMNSDDLNPNNVQHDTTEIDSLIIENGSFDWCEGPVLRNINLRCRNRSLNAVVGTIGSGKSSLISALLGEMEKSSGRVNTVGSIAYVAQQAWIQNATVQDNILFGKPFNKKLYNSVIEACALRQDLEMLPAGDQTEIGEKGINLSGGQKQRVSLARAVYSNSDLYLLDDPLSAVDSHVGKHIFEEVIGLGGLLKSKTRVLVTNAITYLPQMNQIIVLTNGTISETGTYEELMAKMGAFSEFINNYKNDTNEDVDNDGLTRPVHEYRRSVSKLAAATSESSLRKESGVVNRKTSSISNQTVLEGCEIVGERLIDDEKVEKGKVKWEVYKHYLLSVGFKFGLLTVVFTMTTHVFSVGSNVCLSFWSTDFDSSGNNTSKRDMYLGIYGFLGIMQAFATILSSLVPYIGCWYAAKIMHAGMLQSVMRSPLSFFETTPLGRILARFSKDLDDIDAGLPFLITSVVSSIFQVLSTIIVISYTSPIFMAAILPISVIYYLIQRFYISTSRQLERLDSITRSPVYSHFGESISGATTIRAFRKEGDFIGDSDSKVDKNQVYHYASLSVNRWLEIRLELIGNLIMLFAALSAVLGKDRNAGLVGLSMSYALQVTHTLNWLVRLFSEIEINIVSVERIKEYSELTPEAAWEVPNKSLTSTWPDSGSVTFRNYSLRYREGLELILKRINFSIRGGEKIGIVGRTGAGKSSLTLGLFRILEATEGDILIDGSSTAHLGLHFLRSRLTIIPQDNVLFSGSLRMNLDPFDRHSDEQVWKALKNAHLKDFIQDLPSRLNHEVSEGGENLSAGQRQLICLARALLRKTKILILDEATAAVDLETDDLIQRTIHSEFKDCTVLTIAHRLNTIIDSDRVIVLDKGQLAEFDEPQALLRNTKSIFYGMCKDAGLV